MCHAVAAAAPAVHCSGIQPYKGAAWEEGRLLLLSSGGVINYLALCCHPTFWRINECRESLLFDVYGQPFSHLIHIY